MWILFYLVINLFTSKWKVHSYISYYLSFISVLADCVCCKLSTERILDYLKIYIYLRKYPIGDKQCSLSMRLCAEYVSDEIPSNFRSREELWSPFGMVVELHSHATQEHTPDPHRLNFVGLNNWTDGSHFVGAHFSVIKHCM